MFQSFGKKITDLKELSGNIFKVLSLAFEIFNSLERIYKNKTLVLVSHRFSTVRNANKILVIDDGKLIEQGNHKSLLERDGKYAKMFKTQAQGYK